MPANVLFAARAARWPAWRPALIAALTRAGVDFDLRTDFAPEAVDYIVYAPDGDVQDFTPFTKLKAVLSLWAGIEGVTRNPTLRVPLARMVDHGLTQGMTEYVLGHVLRHHLGLDAHIHGLNGQWRQDVPPLAQDRKITILGLGALGAACAGALAAIGFPVTGWSRTAKVIDAIRCTHGTDGLRAALAQAEIVILLLPDTPATENLLNRETLALLPRGAVIVNPGRGTLIDERALLEALDSGRIGHATLDVFRTEPLPPDHRFWTHPRVSVTPHIASETRVATASEAIAENIRRGEANLAFLHLVDRHRGY